LLTTIEACLYIDDSSGCKDNDVGNFQQASQHHHQHNTTIITIIFVVIATIITVSSSSSSYVRSLSR